MPPFLTGVAAGVVLTVAAAVGLLGLALRQYSRPFVPKRGVKL